MNSRFPAYSSQRQRNCCPFPGCLSSCQDLSLRRVVRFGSFLRRSDSRRVPRFRCLDCRRTFSQATLHPSFLQKKRRINGRLYKLLCSGVSIRRSAELLRVKPEAVFLRLPILGFRSRERAERRLRLMTEQRARAEIQFDELETFEHTKLKPLSVALAVDAETREIIGFQVSRMPAKGLLAARSRKRYGKRRDERPQGLNSLFRSIRPHTDRWTQIRSDSNPLYPGRVKRLLPGREHRMEISRRGCIVGQGELKKIGFDPLFSINHTCAMLRANLNRLFRRTWCTTKKPENLAHHIAMYMDFHNSRLKHPRPSTA